MHIGALVLGLIAFLFMVGGFFTTAIPVLGSVLSFGAPLLSLGGIVMAGIAMSRAKQAGQDSGAAIAGLVVNIITFILSLLVALTCGLCNACITTAAVQNPDGQGVGQQFEEAFGQAMESAGARMSLSSSLTSIQSACGSDPSGASAAPYFHDQAFEPLQPTLCASVTPQVVQAFSRDCTSGQQPCSTVAPPDDQASLAAMGVADPTRCSRFSSGTAMILTCNLPTGFKILEVANLSGVQ